MCTPILVGVTSSVSEILLPSKTAIFPFRPMDYSRSESVKKIHASINSNVCTILVGVTSSVSEILLPSKTAIFPFRPMDYSPWSIGIGSKNSCKYKLMSNVCTPILVGMATPVSEILLPSKMGKFPFRPMDMVIKKFNRSESAQKIHASINTCDIHAHQFWWV